MLVCITLGFLSGRAFTNDRVIIKPEPMATARLLERAKAYTKDYPNDPKGFATLGKIHATAFMFQATYLNSKWATQFRKDKPPFVMASKPEYSPTEAEAMIRILTRRNLRQMPPREDPSFGLEVKEEIALLAREGWKEPVMAPIALIHHCKAALAAFEKAANMPPDGIPDHRAGDLLQLAQLHELVLDPKRRDVWQGIDGAPEPAPPERIAGLFARAYDLIFKYDHKKIPGIAWDLPLNGLVSHKAAEGYLRCLPQGPRASEMTAYLQKLREMETKAKMPSKSQH